MPAFRYQALDARGRRDDGVVEADSPRQARSQLRDRGLVSAALEPLAADACKEAGVPSLRPLGANRFRLVLLTRQLASLLGSGLTVERALAALAEQAATRGEREALAAVRSGVLAGRGLAAACAQARFPEIYCALIAAGEGSGRLPAVLAKLADYIERREQARMRVLQALVYPAIVVVVAAAVVAALLGYVVPQLVAVFDATRQTLPWPTRALLATSGFVRASWWPWALCAGFALAAYAMAMRAALVRERVQGLLLRVPLLGHLMRLADTARFAQSVAILTGAGVPILPALDAAGRTLRSMPFKRAVEAAAVQVAEGAPLSQALAAGRRFPPTLVHLVANGEATGTLDAALAAASDSADFELEARAAIGIALIEPALIVLLGGFVLAVVVAVLLPIVEVNQLLGPLR